MFLGPFGLKHPFLLLLLIPVALVLVGALRRTTTARLRHAEARALRLSGRGFRARMSPALPLLRTLGLALVVVALARPLLGEEAGRVETEGVDITLALDRSSSMLALDFEWNGERKDRLYAVKGVADDFVAGRPDDRIGLVAFARYADLVCPATLDHDLLRRFLEGIQVASPQSDEDGTAVGDGLGTALNALRTSKAKSKVAILLSDGENNTGRIEPRAAADIAKALGVRVHTIAAGTRGLAPYPVRSPFGGVVIQQVPVRVDEETLKAIADLTGGRFFRAEDTTALAEVFAEIDRLEKTRIEDLRYTRYREAFAPFLIAALACILTAEVAAATVLRRAP